MEKNKMAVVPLKKLFWKMGLPMIISMVLQALYNVIDSIFITNMKSDGVIANQALTLAFPIQLLIIAIGVGTGVGINALLSKSLGEQNKDKVNKIAGTGLGLLFICGVIIAAIVLLFLNPLLYLFGVTPDVLPYAQDYTFITAFGIPFLVSTTGGTHLIRADRSPTYSMTCMLVGAIINTILDPLFIFTFN